MSRKACNRSIELGNQGNIFSCHYIKNPKVTEDHVLSSLREEIIFDFDFIYLMYFS